MAKTRLLSNDRLLDIEGGKVRFRWKDYRRGNRQKAMMLTADEFIRRFLLHVLPKGFQRIRYYGFLGNRHREDKLARCRQLLTAPQPARPDCDAASDYRDQYHEITGVSLTECPACHRGHMLIIEVVTAAVRCPLYPRYILIPTGVSPLGVDGLARPGHGKALPNPRVGPIARRCVSSSMGRWWPAARSIPAGDAAERAASPKQDAAQADRPIQSP